MFYQTMFDEATLAQIHAKMHGLVSADLSTIAVIGDSLHDLQTRRTADMG